MNKTALTELQEEIHQLAKNKGFYDPPPSSGERYALIHSEISEAVECAREREAPAYYIQRGFPNNTTRTKIEGYEAGEKPLGELIELADVVIRILDYAESQGFELVDVIDDKIDLKNYFEKSSHLDLYSNLHGCISVAHLEAQKERRHSRGFFCMKRPHSQYSPHVEKSELEFVVTAIIEFCSYKSWNLWGAVRAKHEYNKARPHRHGGKKY